MIEFEFVNRWRMRITGAVDPATLAAAVTTPAGGGRAMIPVASRVHVWLATGHTDMRKGFDGLGLLVQVISGGYDLRKWTNHPLNA
jgi:hypothetical protein